MINALTPTQLNELYTNARSLADLVVQFMNSPIRDSAAVQQLNQALLSVDREIRSHDASVSQPNTHGSASI